MKPIQKALWYVESHWREPLTLESVAEVCGVSSYYLTRAFAATMGIPLMRYLRVRRLSEAARQLALGADNILALALECGYGSHEAFTRAFREQFQLTPEQLRERGSVNDLPTMEAILMETNSGTVLNEPRFETPGPLNFAGIVQRYDCKSPAGIPEQWQRFGPHLDGFPKRVGESAYGVCFNFDADGFFDYLCAVQVADDMELPEGMEFLAVPAQCYVVFHHTGHVAEIRSVFAAIWGGWFPQSGQRPANGATLEVYGPEFDPRTGLGGFEIWIPVEA